MKINKLFLTIIFSIFLLGIATAESSWVFKQNTPSTLEVAMGNNDLSDCLLCTCTMSIFYPNGTSMVKNDAGTNVNGYCNYPINQSVLGIYGVEMVFTDTTNFGRSTFEFEVNPQGIVPSDSRTSAITRSIFFVFGIGVLLFLAFLFIKESTPTKLTFLVLSIIFFLIGLNLVSVSLVDEVINPKLIDFFDSFTAISFYLYWFLGGLLALMWAFTFLNTYLYKKNLEAFRRVEG